MNPYHSKRKKIRGWKRRIRQVERWGEEIERPDLTCFERRGYTYERCTLYPFYTLEKRHPPLWFYKHIIAKLVHAHGTWTKIFNEMGIIYDLHLWLYDPDYIRSEIICYKTELPGEIVHPDSEAAANKPFPYNRLGDINYDLYQFDWSIAKDQGICYDYEFENADFTANDLLKDGYELQLDKEGAKIYVKNFGDIWIGRKMQELKT